MQSAMAGLLLWWKYGPLVFAPRHHLLRRGSAPWSGESPPQRGAASFQPARGFRYSAEISMAEIVTNFGSYSKLATVSLSDGNLLDQSTKLLWLKRGSIRYRPCFRIMGDDRKKRSRSRSRDKKRRDRSRSRERRRSRDKEEKEKKPEKKAGSKRR